MENIMDNKNLLSSVGIKVFIAIILFIVLFMLFLLSANQMESSSENRYSIALLSIMFTMFFIGMSKGMVTITAINALAFPSIISIIIFYTVFGSHVIGVGTNFAITFIAVCTVIFTITIDGECGTAIALATGVISIIIGLIFNAIGAITIGTVAIIIGFAISSIFDNSYISEVKKASSFTRKLLLAETLSISIPLLGIIFLYVI